MVLWQCVLVLLKGLLQKDMTIELKECRFLNSLPDLRFPCTYVQILGRSN